MDITSTANPRIKHLAALRRRRARDAEAVTLVEGYEEIELALRAGVRPLTLYYSPGLVRQGATATAAITAGVAAGGGEVMMVGEQAFAKIAYRETPDGWLAVVPAVTADLADLALGARPLVLICQGVEKPGNLGAILRTADAAGVTAVIATDQVTDWGNPNVVRASKGTVFSVPVASATSAQVLAWLDGHGLLLVAAAPQAGLVVTQADLTGPVAIALGSEHHGLPPEWLARANLAVRIPMFGRADSLNVAASAAILCYEAVRQRMGPGPERPLVE
jgi:RNA methyltransferase, TrmH family